jgi:hypothetical protein
LKNFLSFKQLDSALLHKAELNENDIPQTLRIVYINEKLMKMYRLLDGLNDPWYHKQALAVTVTSDVDTLTNAQITSYTASTNTLVRAAGTFKLGQVMTLSFWTAGGAHLADFVGIVASGAGTATAVLTVIGTDADFTGIGTVTILKSAASSVIDLSALYVKDLVRVYDNGYTGGKVRLFSPIADAKLLSVLHRDPFFDGRIAYFHRGDTVELYIGPTAAALGTVSFEYRGKPTPCADLDTDVFIDLPPEDNQSLMDEVLAEYLTHTGKPIPPDVAGRQAEFQAKYGAAERDASAGAGTDGIRGS